MFSIIGPTVPAALQKLLFAKDTLKTMTNVLFALTTNFLNGPNGLNVHPFVAREEKQEQETLIMSKTVTLVLLQNRRKKIVLAGSQTTVSSLTQMNSKKWLSILNKWRNILPENVQTPSVMTKKLFSKLLNSKINAMRQKKSDRASIAVRLML